MPAPKINEQVIKDLCTAHENGLAIKYCAGLVGIHPDTVTAWKKRGEEEPEGIYHDFYIQWSIAHSKFIAYHQGKINDARDWRASRYLLEVSEPDDYVVERRIRAKADVNNSIEKLFDEDVLENILDDD